nr:MAG TPA: hypothetical protein [Caudoviricetes sp.]
MTARILEEHKRHAERCKARLRRPAPAREPIVRVAVPLHIKEETVETRRN